ncbi:hypothetical protein HYH03_001475 [Edaphochlamys debaryana]|uniref:Uncharacterized protein n=1 Tax=Edaphochlamys debaryana TaxID=47281 RepID=A0A836C5B0_9CHLO|nr:hypothetical protein HYH03_001475 [Edaphochlamys debaryana]|eukprot:KAG2500710.1 hypothetical protein HYH03_001475 [Edaphochlamys debaryana]
MDYLPVLLARVGNAAADAQLPNATDSAKIVSRAAARAARCASLTLEKDCVGAAVSLNCRWDLKLSTCHLADLLDPQLLNGLAYCPGSRMDEAVSCALRTPDMVLAALNNDTDAAARAAAACTASSAGCEVLSGRAAARAAANLRLGGVGPGLGPLGGELLDVVSGAVSDAAAAVAESFNVSSSLTGALLDLLGRLKGQLPSASEQLYGQVNVTQACVARWTRNGTFLRSLPSRLVNSVMGGNTDVLSAAMTPELFGSCSGQPFEVFRSTATSCPLQASQLSCDALRGCDWFPAVAAGTGACALAQDALPNIVLDPRSAWVSAVNNASAGCRTLLDALSCGASSSAPLDWEALKLDAPLLANLTDLAPSYLAGVWDRVTSVSDDVLNVINNTINNNNSSTNNQNGSPTGNNPGAASGPAARGGWWWLAVALAVVAGALPAGGHGLM